MPEIKHTFQAGKMNKDLDERIVPNGEYRDAMNIQVRTTDGDAIGTIQNLQGNTEVGAGYYASWMDDNPSRVVASVADEKNDKAYFFIASPPFSYPDVTNVDNDYPVSSERVFIDSIIEQDVNGNSSPVVVDKYAIINLFSEVIDSSTYNPSNYPSGWYQFEVLDGSKYRVGMTIEAINADGNDLFSMYYTAAGTLTSIAGGPGAKIVAIDGNLITLQTEQQTDLIGTAYFVFKHERVLNFAGNIITGVNIIDNLLFWTDNFSEPKKINIDRCKAGTSSVSSHTQLYVKNPLIQGGTSSSQYEIISDIDVGSTACPTKSDLKEEHITTIRRAPRSAPTIHMKESKAGGDATITVEVPFIDGEIIADLEIGMEIELNDTAFASTMYSTDDVLMFSLENTTGPDVVVKVMFLSYMDEVDTATLGLEEVSSPSNTIKVEILSRSELVPLGTREWKVTLQQSKPLYELKFPRFGYRYKYEDGEYSAFSPWSELAFLPGEFDMVAKKGYNLGMVNSVRELIIKDFLPHNRQLDVKEVDILYKNTNNQNVYVVKTIKRTIDEEWELFTPDSNHGVESIVQGELYIDSEMVHKVLPSNQLLRAWDNVPRVARAQEITANRLLFANYLQGYNLQFPVNLEQSVDFDDTATITDPKKSIKSIRNYKVGMVFGDKYGRETPVIESGQTIGGLDDYQTTTGDILLEKSFSKYRNYFRVRQDWSSLVLGQQEPPSYFDYVKYYIKEPTLEYYNIIMDRWYWADDNKENVWISFNSADRNKVDEETYLLLKNQHGNDTAVEDTSRYKILAIEDDAPDFIKTTGMFIGSVNIYPANTLNPTNGILPSGGSTNNGIYGTIPGIGAGDFNWSQGVAIEPEGVMQNTTMYIDAASWAQDIAGWSVPAGAGDPLPNDEIDTVGGIFGRAIGSDAAIKMRLKATANSGEVIYSPWRTLYNYRFVDNPAGGIGTNTQKIEINWDRPWGDDAHMHRQIVDAGYDDTNTQVHIEFQLENTNNWPEFDGRFFCKIEKNYELEYNVLYAAGAATNYNTVASSQYRWLDSDPAVQAEDSMWIGSGAGSGAWASDGFATCSESQQTAQAWYDIVGASSGGGWTINLRGHLFFDSVAARQMSIVKYTTNDPESGYDEATWESNTISGTGTDYDFKPPPFGMEQSTASDGSMGRMYLSRLLPASPYGLPGLPDAELVQQHLQNVGTVFRFGGNPGRYYITIGAEYAYSGSSIANAKVSNFGGCGSVSSGGGISEISDDPGCGICIDELSGTAGTSTIYCERRTLIVEFRELNLSTNQILANGLDIEDYNPASDGSLSNGDIVGSPKHIYIMKEAAIGGSGSVPTELGACWETEPDESPDLDLYYEGSNAIPMRLNSYNVWDFAPIHSTPKLKQWLTQTTTDAAGVETTDTGWFDVELTSIIGTDNTYTTHNITDIQFTDKYVSGSGAVESPLVYITSTNNNGDVIPHTMDFDVGDKIFFQHNDGTETQTEITGHYTPVATPVTCSTPFIESKSIFTTVRYFPGGQNYLVPGYQYDSTTGDYIYTGVSYSGDPIGDITDSMIIIGHNNDETPNDTSDVIPNDTVYTVLTENALGVITPGTTPVTILNGLQDGDGNAVSGSNFTFTTAPASASPVWAGGDWPYIDVIITNRAGWYELDPNVYKYPVKLAWHNCYSYGNGVESDRIRDDYNAPQMGNGIKVSTTLEGYGEEVKSSGIIYSGLYNSTSQVNDLNEFNMAEKITKDLNPTYGSIQALKTRELDVVVFTEDRVLKVLANKEAVYNADGNPQLVATNKVLGQATTFGADYGVSKNPESIAVDEFRMYFTDKQRGAVLRLSMDGITPISNVGMKSWFRENLSKANTLIGSFDDVNGEYNITLNYNLDNETSYTDTTVSFNEGAKGWVSFKSFVPEGAASVSNNYLTAKANKIYKHYSSIDSSGNTVDYNTFYGTFTESSFKVLFNEAPSSIKRFTTVNYEGSQAKINQFGTGVTTDGAGNSLTYGNGEGYDLQDGEYYNLNSKDGWYVNSIETNKQSGKVPEFIEKEGKWFNKISGTTTTSANFDTSEFTVQGIGSANVILGDTTVPGYTLIVQNNTDDSTATISTTASESSIDSTQSSGDSVVFQG